jgi:hypothetical protein
LDNEQQGEIIGNNIKFCVLYHSIAHQISFIIDCKTVRYCGGTTQLNMINQNLERVGIQEDEALENATEKLLVWDRRIDDNLMQFTSVEA